MSVQAMTWVLDEAPDLPHHLVATLMTLANYADKEGRNAFPAQSVIADHVRKSERMVRRDLQQLQDLKLLVEGDQRVVAHIRPDRRPVVWNLCTERKRSDASPRGESKSSKRVDDRKRTSPRKPATTGSGRPPVTVNSGGTERPPETTPTGGNPRPGGHEQPGGTGWSNGGTPMVERGELGFRQSFKNRQEPTSARAPATPVTPIRDDEDRPQPNKTVALMVGAVGATADEARTLLGHLHERHDIRNEFAFVRTMITEGGLRELLDELRAAVQADFDRRFHRYDPYDDGDCKRCPFPKDHRSHLHDVSAAA